MIRKSIAYIVLILGIIIVFKKLYISSEQTLTAISQDAEVIAESPEVSVAEKTSEQIKQEFKEKVTPRKKPIDYYQPENDKTPEVDYVTAFREFQYLKRCRFVYEGRDEGLTPIQKLVEMKTRRMTHGHQWEPMPGQSDLINEFEKICYGYLQDPNENYWNAHERYRKRFYETRPKSQDAKDVARSWELKTHLSHYLLLQKLAIDPRFSDEKAFRKEIDKRIRSHEGIIRYATQNTDIAYSVRTQEEILMFENLITELINLKDSGNLLDSKQLYEDGMPLLSEVDDFLRSTNSGDAFLTVAPYYYPGRLVHMGFYDSQYYQGLLKPAIEIHACSLGLPCDKNSQLMIEKCFLNINDKHSLCGFSAIEYYIEKHFSPNQLLDLEQLFEKFTESDDAQ